jgi:hypothetical protein
MDQRIRDFEPLWNALDHLALQPLPQARLERSTCEHWTLPEAELARWFASPTVAERDAILAANRTPHRFSWNEAPEPDEEEIRLNKELHFGYETTARPRTTPPKPPSTPSSTSKILNSPELTGSNAPPAKTFATQSKTNGFPAPLIAPLLNPDGFPAPLTAPLQVLDQDDIDHYFRSSFDSFGID